MICLFAVEQSYAQIFITHMPDCSKVTFHEDNITIGSCKLNIYMAYTDEQKICGMLNFTDDTFIFASEIKAILAHPDVKPVLDKQGIMELFGLGPAHKRRYAFCR